MMDDYIWVILAIVAVLGLPILAIVAFVMALDLKGRMNRLEKRVESLAIEIGRGWTVAATGRPTTPGEGMPAQAAPEAPPAPAEPAAPPETPHPAEPPESAQEPASLPTPATPPRKRRESLEETLGARWAIWVGGLALTLGGIFLVRYSIEAGLLGPGARILAGLAFALGLIAGGEVLRRRDAATLSQAHGAVYIPGVVTAAGTVALFATVYAAHALYGFIGAGTAFFTLGLVGVATMLAAALHGPWLAGLGLVGAYATPLLVSSQEPNPWALTIFLAAVTAASFALARLRLWRWLAVAASAAALVWGFALTLLAEAADRTPAAAHVAILTGLAVALLVVDPHKGRRGFAAFDGLALAVLAGVAVLALFFAEMAEFSHLGLLVGLGVAAALLAIALAFDAVSPAAGLAALLSIGMLLFWPVGRQIAAEPMLVVPDRLTIPNITPASLQLYLIVAAATGGGLFAATTASLLRRAEMSLKPAIALALSGLAGPLLILASAYVRATNFTASLTFAVVALALAALLAATTRRFLRLEAATGSTSHAAAASLNAAGAAAALALALTMAFEGSPLTFAFALAALGVAWVAMLRPLAALRWSAAGLALLVMLRIGGAWTVLGEALTTFPAWSDIVLRYGVPALAIGTGGHLLRRRAVDAPAALLDGAAIILATMAAALAIRLWVRGPEGAIEGEVGLAEVGLYVTLAFGMAVGFARSALTSTSVVHRIVAPIASLGATILATFGPVLNQNPAMTGEDVTGGAFANSLLLGYALPALFAGLAGWTWNRIARLPAQEPLVRIAGPGAWLAWGACLVLTFLYVTLETRVLVSGPDMNFAHIATAESYAYSAVWLVFGILLLAGGIALRATGARLASALVIMLTVAKVFLVDMSDLEGVWRALSFIGLGAVLIGIGLVYQRLLFAPRGAGEGGGPPP
jgi:uncharacterized membrane protein